MKIRENLSPLINIPRNETGFQNFEFQIGKVYSIILSSEHELFNENGGWDGLGTIFYLDYNLAKNIDLTTIENCKRAKPLFPNQKYYPLIGELVLLFDLPSVTTQVSNNYTQKYYLSPVNIWNNIHHNAQVFGNSLNLGKNFVEKSNIASLLPYEGDYILEGRFGNSIRFTNEKGESLIKLSNGHDNKNQDPYIENINNDSNSLYLTSKQNIDIKVDKEQLNPLTNTIKPKEYNNSQTLINSDRILLNSKKDEVLIFAKTNIEFYTKNVINLDADERLVINSPRIFLGLKDKKLPTEPLLLGNKTVLLLNDLIKELAIFCNKLSQAKSTPQGTPLIDITYAASSLAEKLNNISQKLEQIKSKTSYTT